MHIPLLTGAAAFLLYLALPSYFYNFDGVACAMAVELGQGRHLAHGNHLAYGVLGYLFDQALRLAGYSGQTLASLQLLNAALGAAAAACFSRLLSALGFEGRLALLGGCGLAVSNIFWFWSLEVQVYMLGALFVVLCAAEMASPKPRPVVLGLLHAGAVLGHVLHVCLIPAVCLRLWQYSGPRARSENLLRYGSALLGGAAACYLLAGVLLVRPSGLGDLKAWLLGSAALTPDRSFGWHGGYSLSNLWTWAGMTWEAWARFPPGGTGLRLASTLWCAAATALAAWGAWTSSGEAGRRRTVWLVWLAGYAVLFASWEPWTPVYRITDLVPLWLLLWTGLARLPVRAPWRTGLAASMVLILFGLNLALAVLPHSRPESNPRLERALWIASQTPEEAWVAVQDDQKVYLPYFGRRRPFILGDRIATAERSLRARLSALLLSGQKVYVPSDVLAGTWADTFKGYALREEARQGSRDPRQGGYALYSVSTLRVAPSASGGSGRPDRPDYFPR